MKRELYEERLNTDYDFDYPAPIWAIYRGQTFDLNLFYTFADVLKKIRFHSFFNASDGKNKSFYIVWFHDLGLYSYQEEVKTVEGCDWGEYMATTDVEKSIIIDKIFEKEFPNGIDDPLLQKVMDTLQAEERIKSIRTDLQKEE